MALLQRLMLSTMSAHFHKDLESGQSAENEIQKILESYGCNVTSTQSQLLFDGYDLISISPNNKERKIECKEDKMAFNTGNVAVEISKKDGWGNETKSGLSATQSSHMVYKITYPVNSKYYSIKTENLKQLVRDLKAKNQLKIVWGGDNLNTKMVLIPLFIFRAKCEQLKTNDK